MTPTKKILITSSHLEITAKLLDELQIRLKVGNKRGVHLNAVPSNSRYKFDLFRLAKINKEIPNNFVTALLSEQPLKFKVSWKDNISDYNKLNEDDKSQLTKITKSFENLINQTEAIESEKGINTFGFGFPLLVKRDQSDGKLTVAPILIWSLKIKRSKDFNTWEISRTEEDPVYLNEVLINHLYGDSNIVIDQIPTEMLDDGLISKDELVEICINLISKINSVDDLNLKETFINSINEIKSIGDKNYFEKLVQNSSNAQIEFSGLFSIFEVQKQNIIHDYEYLSNLKDLTLNNSELVGNEFQSISSIPTDPSQQEILHTLEKSRNILIQGPPGTGKSQTLTAILINALENKKKTLVVCEKRTALEVLQNALNEKGLNLHNVLIRDIVKDRKTVVESVRERVDNASYRKFRYLHDKEPLSNLTSSLSILIDSINKQHKSLDKKYLGTQNWTNIIGSYLKEIRINDDQLIKPTFDNLTFNFTSSEFFELMNLIKKASKLFENQKCTIGDQVLNVLKYTGEDPFEIQRSILTDFKFYKTEITKLKNNRLEEKWWQKLFGLGVKKKIFQLKSKIFNDNWPVEFKDSSLLEDIINEIDQLILKVEKYFENKDRFLNEFKWFNFYFSLNDEQRIIIDKLIPTKNWEKSFLHSYYESLLSNNQNINLPTDDDFHQEFIDKFSALEKEQLKFIKDYWFSNQIDKTREFEKTNSNLTVENLYNKRSGAKFKRLSLRQIIKHDVDLFTSFFPVILTTPDVASNLFKGMNEYFDIVMFDEASQLRLEDNLPALLKGKQIIIAGDEHQMPPSNYFSKVFEGVIEDEEDEEEVVLDNDNVLLSCESLLDFGTELKFDKQHLDFHYRSKHPYLIDFSNYAFYNQRLKPLPSSTSELPIKYYQIDGNFVEYVNDSEANKVLDILENEIHRLSNGEYPTVGIATFNIAQRNHIKSKIIERQQNSKFFEFNRKIQELEEKGLFIKNLENIQGDERDVIILSTTYGLNKEGKFVQRFGPINQVKGYKLLNVIITRAKHQIFVCTSIPENVFMNYKDYLVTEGNNKKAVFYAYLAYCKAISECNLDLKDSILLSLSENFTSSTKTQNDQFGELESPFEEEVFERLKQVLEPSKLTLQEKVSEFIIDMVYDPKIDGIPKIAIECDGAKYHSSREAYLYDIHRQKILENHGYVFHRIWSTNWWRNPEKETNKLVEFIRGVEEK